MEDPQLSPTGPDFFTEADFDQLEKFAQTRRNKENPEHTSTYDYLAGVYKKIEYWAEEARKKVFPEGKIDILKKPTNQASHFEWYLWAKVFPDKLTLENNTLAFTIQINTDFQFIIKIDTLNRISAAKRNQYEQIRGDYNQSSIVKIYPADEMLDKNWDYLINLTVNILQELTPEFNRLFSILNEGPNRANSMTSSKIALNTILYGPPGTGKTFNTFSKALSIANPTFSPNSKTEEKKKEYQRLLKEGQIKFVTFHQNYSYEDFVLGIRPDLDTEEMKFCRYEGIFFRICSEAYKNYLDTQSGRTYKVPTFEELLNEFLKPLTEEDKHVALKTKTGVEFKIIQRNRKNLNFEKSSGTRDHTLSLSTLKEIYTGERIGDTQGLMVYYIPLVEILKQKAKEMREEVGKIALQNYVLIIDEINRANISRVFGELITLLEADKRLGGDYELTVTLPNGEEFAVPPNLYIIGTMNTADKSIALLDIALRRRFVFEPVDSGAWYPPNPIYGNPSFR